MKTDKLQARSLAPALTVGDLERSIQFYTEGLGFALDEKMEENGELHGVMLEAGGAKLGLSRDDFAKGRDRVKGVGMRLYLETTQDVKALATQAKAAGITLDQEAAPLPWGPIGFTVTDPDGFKLTIANPE
ncbi:MAG: VOC family protein [Gemmatimonadaceae bacterium]|nr:VOC family protein [Gemmatimonadaceae bacterium]MDQ3518167.1 VOC family protein [Gemmatimonadota bacterium]